ncbi:MAG: hypothetical protein ACREYE_30680, partial [Gammaproteobacteria bacterium]
AGVPARIFAATISCPSCTPKAATDDIKNLSGIHAGLPEGHDQERNELAEHVAVAKQQLEEAQERIMGLEKHEQWNWFITGVAVFGSGIIVGVLLPRLRLRRRAEFEIRVP